MIEAIEAEEAMYEKALRDAYARGMEARQTRRRAGRVGPGDLQERLRDIGIATEAALWDQTAKRLHHARRELETLRTELQGEPDG